ncbi:MAG: M15 family metallopeptidase [Armatimonadota bacterium]
MSRTFDERTEKTLATLLPAVVPTFRQFLAAAVDEMRPHGLTVIAISGHRSYAEQTALYAKGRTAPGPKVTNAKAGQSNHNFALAIDIGLFRGKAYLTESPFYAKIGPIGERAGLDWGGRWKSVDTPHYEYPTGLTMAQKRDRVAKGIPLVHVPVPVVTIPKVWTVELDDETIIQDCRDTPSVRAVVEALGGTIEVRNADKVIIIHPKKS